jgi:hypothetical protein
MFDEESQSLKALAIALDRIQEPPNEQTQLNLSQTVKRLRLIIRDCFPLNEFYNQALDQIREKQESQTQVRFTTSKRSFSDLEGLGKEIWQGMDAQVYVDRERDSWNG